MAEKKGAAARKTKIYNAARDLFFKYGYRGTSMEMIARQAGYSKKSIYLDYRNKDDLFLHLVVEGTAILLDKLLQIPHERLEVEEAIIAFFKVYYDFSSQFEAYFKMAFSEATPELVANASAEVQLKLAELSQACMEEAATVARRAIEAGIVLPIDPWTAAGVFLGAATGNIMLARGAGQTLFAAESLKSISDKSIKIILRGIRVAPGDGTDLL